MKLGFIILSGLLAGTLAIPAAAQESVRASVTDVATATVSESSVAGTEWYREFASSQSADTKPSWQVEPEEDFSMHFGTDKRWQLNLDRIVRSDGYEFSPLPREEVQAGATFKITPRFSVGGEVSLGTENLNDVSEWEEREVETGVRLKSAFKF